MNTHANGAFSLNLKSLDGIAANAKRDADTALQKAAQQFEALLVQRMLHSMREAMPESGLLKNQQTQKYNELLDNQLAQSVSQRGIGLADLMVRQLRGGASVAARSPADHRPMASPDDAAIPTAQPKSLAASTPVERSVDARQAQQGGPLIAASSAPAPLIERQAPSHSSKREAGAGLPAYARQFLSRMGSAADAAARETGLSRRVILAQAALETGWGQHEISGSDGSPSHNVFNIKATHWNGQTAAAQTREYQNGREQSVNADFRAYGSYREAFSDYADLIANSPRYRSVVDAPTPTAAADQLQASGYATDPDYAAKLKTIMTHIPDRRATAIQSLINPAGGPLIDARAATNDTRTKPSGSDYDGAIDFG